MKFPAVYFVAFLLLMTVACEKGNLHADLDCATFQESLIELNDTTVGNQLNVLTADLTPRPTAEDPLGHAGNIETLIDRLQSQCDTYQVELRCYPCTYTLFAQTELAFALDSAGFAIERTVNLITPENEVPAFIHMH